MKNKILTIDSSGFNPFQYSIRKKSIVRKDLGSFFEQQNIKLCIAKEICPSGEFSYAEQGDLYTYQAYNSLNETTASLKNKIYEIGENGTMIEATEEKSELKITVISMTKKTTTNIKDLKNWSSPKISDEDKMTILLAKSFPVEYYNVAILANDQRLRKHSQEFEISTYGSSSLLASLVLAGMLEYQKGTSMYKSWYTKNCGWIPKDLTFGNVLNIERKRIKNNESFFIN